MISGTVVAKATVKAYGFTVLETEIDPCGDAQISGLCPMQYAPLDLTMDRVVDAETVKAVPGELRRGKGVSDGWC